MYSDDHFFTELDEKTFPIKHKTYNWPKETERGLDEAKSRRSSFKKG